MEHKRPPLKQALLVIVLVLSSLCSYGQLAELRQVQSARTMAKHHAKDTAWSLACEAYRKFAGNPKYANPYDHLDYSYLSLKRGDTATFAQYLEQAIRGGVDTVTIRRFYRRLGQAEQSRLDRFIADRFEPLHRAGLANYDTTTIRELQSIHELDQLLRTQIDKIVSVNPSGWKTDSGLHYLTRVAKFADSVNYTRVIRLFRSGRFPGYQRCGAAAISLGQALMHFDGPYVDWDYVFGMMKGAVLSGDMDPDQVAGIVDRHYLGRPGTSGYYYGRLKWGEEYPFYDCKQVDRFRAEIGLESLKSEYERGKRALPACYEGG